MLTTKKSRKNQTKMPCVTGDTNAKCESCRGTAGTCVINIKSYCLGGFEFKIKVDTTARHCIKEALKFMQIPENYTSFFSLQCEFRGEKTWIKDGESVFRQINSLFPCRHSGKTRFFTVYLRLRYLGVSDTHLDNTSFKNFMFHQLKVDFKDGLLTKNASEIVSLAAYLLHYASLTLLSHVLPIVDFEQKLRAALPKRVQPVKLLVPYIQKAMKIVSSLTLEQTIWRFIRQCQLLSHYGAEKFVGKVYSIRVPNVICFSCSGLILDKSVFFSAHVLEWEYISTVRTKSDVLIVEFKPSLQRRPHIVVFSSPKDAGRACTAGLMQRKMAENGNWKRPSLSFQPLIHVPSSLLQFQGESDKLSAVIKDIFAGSIHNLNHTPSVKEPGPRFLSEANIPAVTRFEDNFSCRSSAEESTIPLIYGSILAQSTPVLRHDSSTEPMSRVGFSSVLNLPHKKRLAASRPFVNATSPTEPSVRGGFFSNSVSQWTVCQEEIPITRFGMSFSAACVNSSFAGDEDSVASSTLPLIRSSQNNHNHHQVARHTSDAAVILRSKGGVSGCYSPNDLDDRINSSELDRCSSLVFRSSASNISEAGNANMKGSDRAVKFVSECVLTEASLDKGIKRGEFGEFDESADDLTALPLKTKVNTLPASLKRSSRFENQQICIELIQKLRHKGELEAEYAALPHLDNNNLNEGVVTIDLDLPIKFFVNSQVCKGDFESADFWLNISSLVVLLSADFLTATDELANPGSVLSLLQSDVVTGDEVSLGDSLLLSLCSVTRSPSCHIFGIHIKNLDGPSEDGHFHPITTTYLFCWIGDFTTLASVAPFATFVDEIVATDLSSGVAASTIPHTSIMVASGRGSLSLCSLYIVCHVLLRKFRFPKQHARLSVKSIYDTVSAVRHFLPCTVVSIDEYAFVFELLLRWLEKPPRLI